MDLVVIVSAAVGLAFFLYWGVVFVILYHLTRFGVGILPKRLAALFLLGSVVLFSISLALFMNVDFKIIFK